MRPFLLRIVYFDLLLLALPLGDAQGTGNVAGDVQAGTAHVEQAIHSHDQADVSHRDADGFQHAVQRLITERIKTEFFTDGLEQALTPLRGGIGVLIQMLVALVTLQLLNHPPGQQLHIGVAPGEVQILAAIHDVHMDLHGKHYQHRVHKNQQQHCNHFCVHVLE